MSLDQRRRYSEQCTRCSQCKFVPMAKSSEFASQCPSIDYGQFHAFSGGGKVISSYAYNLDRVAPSARLLDSVYACSMCGACDTVCKTHMGDNVEPFETLLAFRARLVDDGNVPPQVAAIAQHLEQEGSALGPRAQRAAWCNGLDLKDARTQTADVLLHVGSENAFDKSRWDELLCLVRLLRAAGVDFAIAFEDESDAGGEAFELGYRDLGQAMADEHIAMLKACKARTLLVAGAQDYAAFKNLYPRMGKPVTTANVLHTTQFIEQLIAGGKLSLQLAQAGVAVYHDACTLGRRGEAFEPWHGEKIRVLNTMLVSDSPRKLQCGTEGNFTAPRLLLGRINGLELVELERNREFAYCCGGGCTGVKQGYPDMAELAARNVVAEAEASGANILVSASAACASALAKAAEEHAAHLRVATVFELLAESITEEN